MLIDTHSHIYSEEFDGDRDEVVARAEEAGVGMIFLPAIDEESHIRQEELASSRPDLFRQMMGLHPTSVGDNYISRLEVTRQKLFDNPKKYVAIGEVGLDYYWDITFRQQQIDALEQQLTWCEQLGKPVVLHLRNSKEGTADAYASVFTLLQSHPTVQGIMHCFSGTINDARRAVSMGFVLGIGGVVTYKKSQLPEIVRAIPLESIVLETDSPYLAPVPHRGQRNESAYVTHVADAVALIKGCTPEQVADITSQNAIRIMDGCGVESYS